MATETIPFTREGYDRLKKELDELKTVERPKVITEIAEARAHGDLSENAEYHAAREKQGFIEARIADLDDKLSRAEVVESSGENGDLVRFGAWVTLEDEEDGKEKSYRIVGELEASQPALFRRAEANIALLPADAARWVFEMQEIASTLRSVGLPGGFHDGAAAVFELLAQTPFAAETRETLDRSRSLDQAVRVYAETGRSEAAE